MNIIKRSHINLSTSLLNKRFSPRLFQSTFSVRLLLVMLCLLGTSLSALPTFACLWDKDTLTQERKRMPTVFELLTGQFPRHSQDFYRWRIEDRTRAIKESPWMWLLEDSPLPDKPDPPLSDESLRWTDDLSVAFDKTGQTTRGLRLLARVQHFVPKRYETLANLGTLSIHSGALTEGIKWIKEALKINPNAHFGRERIQLNLIEYVIERRRINADEALPLDRSCLKKNQDVARDPWLEGIGSQPSKKSSKMKRHLQPRVPYTCVVMGARPCRGFCGFLKSRKVSIQEGIKGVTGMMRFSDPGHPILLEVLGDLMIDREERKSNNNRLAAMAYLRAAQALKPLEASPSKEDASAKNPASRPITVGAPAYLTLSALSLVGHRFGLLKIHDQLKRGLVKGDRLLSRIAKDEGRWMKSKPTQVETRYQKKYLKGPWAPQKIRKKRLRKPLKK
jgi:hypothetical protein